MSRTTSLLPIVADGELDTEAVAASQARVLLQKSREIGIALSIDKGLVTQAVIGLAPVEMQKRLRAALARKTV